MLKAFLHHIQHLRIHIYVLLKCMPQMVIDMIDGPCIKSPWLINTNSSIRVEYYNDVKKNLRVEYCNDVKKTNKYLSLAV